MFEGRTYHSLTMGENVGKSMKFSSFILIPMAGLQIITRQL